MGGGTVRKREKNERFWEARATGGGVDPLGEGKKRVLLINP